MLCLFLGLFSEIFFLLRLCSNIKYWFLVLFVDARQPEDPSSSSRTLNLLFYWVLRPASNYNSPNWLYHRFWSHWRNNQFPSYSIKGFLHFRQINTNASQYLRWFLVINILSVKSLRQNKKTILYLISKGKQTDIFILLEYVSYY